MINPTVQDLIEEMNADAGVDLPAYEPVRHFSKADRKWAARQAIQESSRLANLAEADRNMLLHDLASAMADQLMGDGEGVTDCLIADLEDAIAEAERRLRRYSAARSALRDIAGYS